jgi:molybdopterin molybdotransferase
MAVPWSEARVRAHAAVAPLPPRAVPLAAALGGALAADLCALADLPVEDVAAMDGYAVAAEPAAGPWRVVRRVLAGAEAGPPLTAGEAAEVATGAPVPAGTAAVLPYECATASGATVRGEVTPNRHVRRRGENHRAGTSLLPAGTPVTPVVLGLAASAGHDTLRVRPAPAMAAFLTGDELLTAGLPRPGRVRDAVGPLLAGLYPDVELRHLPDRPGALASALAGSTADVLLTCGASAAGPADHLRAVLAELGATTVVDSVDCRPGHPQSLSLLPDGRPLVGLPGNPLAALAALLTLVPPVLAALRGRPLPPLPVVSYAGPPVTGPTTRLVPVTVDAGVATPTGVPRSASLLAAATADALAAVTGDTALLLSH